MTILTVSNLTIFINDLPLLEGVSFSLESENIYHLCGANGTGKTTLFDAVLGLNKNISGDINLKARKIGYLPQVAHQFPKIYLEFRDICDQEFSFYPKELFLKSWHKASGGERKKALIARALHEAKDFLILDEPFNHLDKESIELVKEELLKYTAEGGCVFFTGHAANIDKAIHMEVDQWKS